MKDNDLLEHFSLEDRILVMDVLYAKNGSYPSFKKMLPELKTLCDCFNCKIDKILESELGTVP